MRRIGEHFVTCGQMKLLEQRADADGLSYYQMMENAGIGAARFIMELDAYQNAVQEDAKKDVEAMRGAGLFAAEENIAETFAAESAESEQAAKLKQSAKAGILARPTKPVKFVESAVSGHGRILRSDAAGNTGQPKKTLAKKVYLFCGKGNNGGDGFVVARLMSDAGYDVTVILVEGHPKTEDAIVNFDLLAKRPIKILDMNSNGRALMELDGLPHIIVDAMYGTGFHGQLASNGLKAAIYINRYARRNIEGTPVAPVMAVSLDIPSGIGGDLIDEKDLDENAVAAHHTIVFHARKPVHLQKFASKYCGEISVIDIGIDEERLWNVEF